jgi:hypothetical protein
MKLLSTIFVVYTVIATCGISAHAQRPDTLPNPSVMPVDSVLIGFDSIDVHDSVERFAPPKKKGFIGRFFADYPNPNKALYAALAFPGGGQLYNKRWWKVPLAYGGYAAFLIAIDRNTKRYRLYRDAYIAELRGEQHPFSGTGLDAGDLRRIRDGYDKNKQLSYIGLFATHLVVTAEAFVDAHLRSFDVSDDLSLQLAPRSGCMPTGEAYAGAGLILRF